jgi:hypothetical protein
VIAQLEQDSRGELLRPNLHDTGVGIEERAAEVARHPSGSFGSVNIENGVER